MHSMTPSLVFVSWLVFSPASGDLTSDPVFGLWQLNEAKCQFSSTAPSVSVIRSYQNTGEGLTRISETRVIPDGTQIEVEYVASDDGKEYPIFITQGDTRGRTKSDDTVSFRRVNRNMVEGVFRNHGNRRSEFTRVVSKDGQRLYVRIVGIDSAGSQTMTLLVYDRLDT